jgi:hypothetical protein
MEAVIDNQSNHRAFTEYRSRPQTTGGLLITDHGSPITAFPPITAFHTATTSSSGSIRRTIPSIPANVPEMELGQLPQAPW